MASIESEMEQKSAEEIAEILSLGADKFNFEEEREYSKEEIRDVFRYLYALMLENDHEQASHVLNSLRPIIDRFGEKKEDFEAAFDFLMEWSQLAIRLTPEDKNEFTCMPVYLDLLEVLNTAPAALKYKTAKVRLQMAVHYDLWLNRGGNIDSLPEEDYELLAAARETFLQEAPGYLEQAKAGKDADACVALLRNLSRYYLNENQPNEALKYMKEIPDHLPGTKEYHPADMGDVYMEIGKIFMSYKKYATAKKYFEMAREVYLSQGPDWEIVAVQAEANIETCDSFLA